MTQSIPPLWRILNLGEITVPAERKDPTTKEITDSFNYIDISAVDNVTKQVVGNLERKIRDAPSRARQIVYPGDVLVSTVRPALNAVAAVPAGLANIIASTGFCVLRPRPTLLLSEYLFHFLITDPFVQALVSKQKGGAYPAVTDEDVRTVKIPLPPLSEQKRIVEVLQEAEAIRRLRADAEAKTAELIPAMFHDQFVNEQAYGFQPLYNLAEIVSGVAIGRKIRGMATEVPYLRVANVQAGYIDLDEVKSTKATEGEIIQFGLIHGDVLLTEGGDFDKLGRGCLWDGQIEPCIHQNHVFRVRPFNRKLNSRFFANYLQSEKAKNYFLRCAKKTTNLASINLSQLKNLPVPIVSIEEQEAFEHQIQAAFKCSSSFGEKVFTSLSASLSANAFSGQLTAEWREDHAEQLVEEARERNAALKSAGAIITITTLDVFKGDEDFAENPTDGIYSDLNREQRDLLMQISLIQNEKRKELNKPKPSLWYFTSESLSKSLEGGLRRNPQAIEGHLAVFAARGLVIPLSREEQTEDTGEFVFGNAYRLPISDESKQESESRNSAIIGEAIIGDAEISMDPLPSDSVRGRELERLAAQLEKEHHPENPHHYPSFRLGGDYHYFERGECTSIGQGT